MLCPIWGPLQAPVGSPVPVTTAADSDSAVIMEVVAITDYNPDTMSPFGNAGDELKLVKGQVVRVHGEPGTDGYYVGESNEKWGLIPSSVVQPVNPVAAASTKPAVDAATATPTAAPPPSEANCLVKAMYAYQGQSSSPASPTPTHALSRCAIIQSLFNPRRAGGDGRG